MEHVSNTEGNTVAENPPSAPRRQYFDVATFAFLNAALWGAVGAIAGHYLGRLGDHVDRQQKLAKPILRIVLGMGGAVVGAYSVFKAADKEVGGHAPAEPSTTKTEADVNPVAVSAPVPNKLHAPQLQVQADTAQHAGGLHMALEAGRG